MTMFQIRLAMIGLLFGLTMCAGCNRGEPTKELTPDNLAAFMLRGCLKTAGDVQAVVSNAAVSPRAIMFVHVDWAIMEPQRYRYAEFVLEYQRMYPDDPVLFHYVDCTTVSDNYAPLKALPGWQDLENAAGTSLIHGWGELVWMEKGHVLHVEPILDYKTTSDLVQKTRSLMASQTSG